MFLFPTKVPFSPRVPEIVLVFPMLRLWLYYWNLWHLSLLQPLRLFFSFISYWSGHGKNMCEVMPCVVTNLGYQFIINMATWYSHFHFVSSLFSEDDIRQNAKPLLWYCYHLWWLVTSAVKAEWWLAMQHHGKSSVLLLPSEQNQPNPSRNQVSCWEERGWQECACECLCVLNDLDPKVFREHHIFF